MWQGKHTHAHTHTVVGKACENTRIPFDRHWLSWNDHKCQQGPEKKNNRERMKMYVKYLLNIPINFLKCFHVLAHRIETEILMFNGMNSAVTTLIINFQLFF